LLKLFFLISIERYGGTCRTYIIQDIVKKTPRDTFERRTKDRDADGNPVKVAITYQDYFEKIVGTPRIRDPHQPLIEVIPYEKKRGQELNKIYLIPELVYPLGLYETKKKNQKTPSTKFLLFFLSRPI
jgi:hypothetical protein